MSNALATGLIDASGQVMPCAYRGNYTNLGLSSCGNVNESPLNDIWYGIEFQQLRREMFFGNLDAAGCANCYALKQGQPLQLEYDLDVALENPPHTPYARNLALKRRVIGFFPYQNGRPSWECTHYAEIINGEYEAYLPAGNYAYGIFPVMAWPYCLPYTKISIPQMHRSYSLLPMALYALRLLRDIFRGNEKNNLKKIFSRAIRGLSRLER
jgi:hypothetical protein